MAGGNTDDAGDGNPGKDGLKAAIDVTRYTLAVAGAAIAFLVGADIHKTLAGPFARTMVTLSLTGFAVSAIGGLLVLLQSASNLSNASYDLNQPFLKYPGIANILGLMAGFFFATVFIIAGIWTPARPG